MYTREALHCAEVLVSEVLESRDVPDPYFWRFNQKGQLISENDDTPIEEIVARNNQIGEIEYQALLKIQRIAQSVNSGFIVWGSPIDSIYYPDTSKIVVSEKIGDRLLNRSIKVSLDVIGMILAARELASLSELEQPMFRTANDVRANPI
ncbi:MAG: hypothetical protein AAB656_00560, partial [Patescibacteria group bacterium]